MSGLPELHPEVRWAQRSSSTEAERNVLYVTIIAPDVSKDSANLKATSTNISFSGDSRKGVKYNLSLDLYAEIDTNNSKLNHNDRGVEMVLRKKELNEEYWPRLQKNKEKLTFLKTDFDKWVDEDEQDEAADDDYANNFGGGLDEGGGLGNIDFSKLGVDPATLAAAQAGEGGQGEEAGEGEEEEEEDMPELESADDKKAEGSGNSKIQEVS